MRTQSTCLAIALAASLTACMGTHRAQTASDDTYRGNDGLARASQTDPNAMPSSTVAVSTPAPIDTTTTTTVAVAAPAPADTSTVVASTDTSTAMTPAPSANTATSAPASETWQEPLAPRVDRN